MERFAVFEQTTEEDYSRLSIWMPLEEAQEFAKRELARGKDAEIFQRRDLAPQPTTNDTRG